MRYCAFEKATGMQLSTVIRLTERINCFIYCTGVPNLTLLHAIADNQVPLPASSS